MATFRNFQPNAVGSMSATQEIHFVPPLEYLRALYNILPLFYKQHHVSSILPKEHLNLLVYTVEALLTHQQRHISAMHLLFTSEWRAQINYLLDCKVIVYVHIVMHVQRFDLHYSSDILRKGHIFVNLLFRNLYYFHWTWSEDCSPDHYIQSLGVPHGVPTSGISYSVPIPVHRRGEKVEIRNGTQTFLHLHRTNDEEICTRLRTVFDGENDEHRWPIHSPPRHFHINHLHPANYAFEMIWNHDAGPSALQRVFLKRYDKGKFNKGGANV